MQDKISFWYWWHLYNLFKDALNKIVTPYGKIKDKLKKKDSHIIEELFVSISLKNLVDEGVKIKCCKADILDIKNKILSFIELLKSFKNVGFQLDIKYLIEDWIFVIDSLLTVDESKFTFIELKYEDKWEILFNGEVQEQFKIEVGDTGTFQLFVNNESVGEFHSKDEIIEKIKSFNDKLIYLK